MYERISILNKEVVYDSLNQLNKDNLEPYIGPRPFNRTSRIKKNFLAETMNL